MVQLTLMIGTLLTANGISTTASANYPQLARTVKGEGVVEARRSVELRNRAETSTAILYVAPEGSEVMQGDLIVELDDTALQLELEKLTIAILIAEGKLAEAEAALMVVNSEAQAEIELAKMRYDLAALNQQRQLGDDGELELEIKTAQAQIRSAQEKLVLGEQRLASLKKSEGEPTDQEVLIKLQIAEAKASLEAATARLKMLEGPERRFRTAQLKLETREAQLELDRTENNFKIEEAQAKADLQAANEEHDLEKRRLEKVKQQIEACRIQAPQDGTVSYAHVRNRRGGAELQIEEGAMVRPRQTIAYLPDMSQLQVKVLIKESDVNKLRIGQTARIQIDAYPDQTFDGKVTGINPYPEAAGWTSRDDVRRYGVFVSIENHRDQLKLGMSATVEIDLTDR